MKNVAIYLFVIASMTLVGCSKIKEIKSLGENLANMAETASSFESIEDNKGDFDPANFDMSEAEVRDFYRAVDALTKKYPDVYFEVPYSALIQAMETGINLKKVIEAETKYSFEEFNRISTVLIAVRMQGLGTDLLAGIDEGLAELDTIDLSELEGEEREAAEAKLAETRKEMAAARSELDSDEMKKLAAANKMVTRVRAEFNLPE